METVIVLIFKAAVLGYGKSWVYIQHFISSKVHQWINYKYRAVWEDINRHLNIWGLSQSKMLAYLKWKWLLPVPGIYETGGIRSLFALYLSTSRSPDVPHSLPCHQHLLTHANKYLSLSAVCSSHTAQMWHLLEFVIFEENKSITKLKSFLLSWLCFKAPLPEILSPYPASSFPLKFLYLLPGLEGGLLTPFLFSKTIFCLTVQRTIHVHLFLVFWFLFVCFFDIVTVRQNCLWV